jgi:NAD(P)-dependent dehydrogenase (short-subunit alcohol dehydrogenase family)
MTDPRRYLLIGDGLSHRLAQRIIEHGDCALTISVVRPNREPLPANLTAHLRTASDWSAAVQAGFDRLGGVDVLINCRGTSSGRSAFTTRADDDWTNALRQDVLPLLRACLTGIELMHPGNGVVVNLTDERAWPDDPFSAPALASFAALEATTHTLALHAHTRRMRLFGIAPSLNTRTRPRRAPTAPARPVRPVRFPLVGFAASNAVTDSILDVIADPAMHDATYRLASGQYPPLYRDAAFAKPATVDVLA